MGVEGRRDMVQMSKTLEAGEGSLPAGDKIPVAVLGATGLVGQRFLSLLAGHPWFRVAAVAGSERRLGQRLGDSLVWRLEDTSRPEGEVLDLPLRAPDAAFDVPVVFSALPTAVAEMVEPELAARGHAVFSNASSYRMAADVPLLIPEVNPGHLGLLHAQQAGRGWSGFLLTNPNCSTIQIVLALKPLVDRFGLRRLHVTTLQAISGAGYPGVAAYDIVDNAIPYIPEEEEKIERETRKILGRFEHDHIAPAPLAVSATCTRVAVREGHLACVSVELETDHVTGADLAAAWSEFQGNEETLTLPSSPNSPVIVRSEPDRPQPLYDRSAGNGMAVVVGRIRQCENFGHKFVVLGHNTIRGAAGASLQNAELAHRRGLF